jgi:hypothetical protein
LSRPEWVKRLAKGYLWLDPGISEARERVISVVLDIAERYAIEGIVLDDYFYPYAEYYEKGETFPDASTYEAYLAGGGTLRLADFRRASVTSLVARMGEALKDLRPELLFGVAPFGIWRPGEPDSVAGKDAFAESFADSRDWAAKGFVDFLSPQLYWPIGKVEQSFPVLLSWWLRQKADSVRLWPSIQPGSAKLRDEERPWEAVAEVMVERGMAYRDPGVVIYNAKALRADAGGFVEALKSGPFAKKAFYPVNPRVPLSPVPPPELRIVVDKGRAALDLSSAPGSFLEYRVAWRLGEGGSAGASRWRSVSIPAQATRLELPPEYLSASPEERRIVAVGIDRFGSASLPASPKAGEPFAKAGGQAEKEQKE